MYDHILEEMADAIAFELNVTSNNVLGVLNCYWQDKIAHVWQVDDMLESARRAWGSAGLIWMSRWRTITLF